MFRTPDPYEDHEAADAEANSADGWSPSVRAGAGDPVHGGCFQPHLNSRGDYVDCDGRPL
ncbi:hypothetical protein [Kitasatospora sp. NPDC093679]|uniref:hypothetical protein n=1 Tax=Kitasatospora sp. NPDC093679 TaxID=3154983 RepID=UPI0034288872